MKKNNIILLLLFVILSAFYISFNYYSSKYDCEVTELLTHSLPFKLNIRWYEANFEIIEEDSRTGIMVANNNFPFGCNINCLYINKILKYSKSRDFLAVLVATPDGPKLILINDYNIEFGRWKFKIIELNDLKRYKLSKWVDLDVNNIPPIVQFWPILGRITLIFLFIFLIIIISKCYQKF